MLVAPGRISLSWPDGQPPQTTVTSDASITIGRDPATGVLNAGGQQFSAPTDWDTQRANWSPLLDTLEWGVDYGPRPDRNENDPDAYVQYADGPNEHEGWNFGAITVGQVFTNFGASSAVMNVGLEPNTNYPGNVDQPIGPFPGMPPNVYATWGTNAATGSTFPGPADPGPVKQFSLYADITSYAGTGLVSFGSRQDVVRMRVLQPAWRYWIPGDAPVAFPIRQKQRNDGLGRGVVRARSTSSVQGSIRQRSYR